MNVRHVASDALTDHFVFRLFETVVLIMRMRHQYCSHPVLTALYFFVSRCSEDTSFRGPFLRGTGHADVPSYSENEGTGRTDDTSGSLLGRQNRIYTFVPLAHIPSQTFLNIANNELTDVKSGVSSQSSMCSNLNSNVGMKVFEIMKAFKCKICDKEFSTKGHLNKHSFCHKDDRPFICSICNKTFKQNYQLTAHNKRHKGTNDYVCDICGYATISNYTLALHTKRHLGEYNFKCDVCSKCFISKHALKNHKIVHSGDKPFKCDYCERAYFYKGDLTTHNKICHPAPEQDKSEFQCRTCGLMFRLKKRLMTHLKSHTGFLCDVCGKALTSQTSLQVHHLTHTGEKPVVCDVCGKAFVKNGALRIHMLTHTGERPHTCEVCGKKFTQRSSLTIHKRYHTGSRPYRCNICHKHFVTKTLMKTHQKCHGISS